MPIPILPVDLTTNLTGNNDFSVNTDKLVVKSSTIVPTSLSLSMKFNLLLSSKYKNTFISCDKF